jgi:hypothetical protein
MLKSPACRVLIAALACAMYAQGFAQFGRGRGRIPPARLATDASFDGSWHLCRLAYQGRAWATDYPDADYNFSTRLSELTKTAVSRRADGEPNPLIVRPSDPALFHCSFVMLWQAESLWLSDEDAKRLREYLLKGGFIWSDDSWGSYAWENFAAEMSKVLPPSRYPFVDIPPSHAMFAFCSRSPRCRRFPGSVIGIEAAAALRNRERTAPRYTCEACLTIAAV